MIARVAGVLTLCVGFSFWSVQPTDVNQRKYDEACKIITTLVQQRNALKQEVERVKGELAGIRNRLTVVIPDTGGEIDAQLRAINAAIQEKDALYEKIGNIRERLAGISTDKNEDIIAQIGVIGTIVDERNQLKKEIEAIARKLDAKGDATPADLQSRIDQVIGKLERQNLLINSMGEMIPNSIKANRSSKENVTALHDRVKKFTNRFGAVSNDRDKLKRQIAAKLKEVERLKKAKGEISEQLAEMTRYFNQLIEFTKKHQD